MMKMTKTFITGDIDSQLLGRTTEHLHYFTDNLAIHKEMLNAYKALSDAAKRDGLSIRIASGYRSFERQLHIWNNKFLGKTPILDEHNQAVDTTELTPYQIIQAIMLYSALPGASRHHWGCDIDVYADNLLDNNYQVKIRALGISRTRSASGLIFLVTSQCK